jgi:hypothetical protein
MTGAELARRDKMVGLVERMQMTADGVRLTADGPKRAECSLLVACDR